MRRSSIFFLCLLATAACRGDDDGDGDDTDGNNNPDAPSGDMRVQDVQNDATPIATPVTLRGVIVTAIDNYGPRKGNFYVAEPGGGEFSGVLVFGAPLEQVADLVVGDLVDITNAEKDEFSLETDDRTVTELVPITGGEMTVTRVGTDTVPAPHVIDALAVGMMQTQAREDEYEKWEGVLVTVNNVTVTSELRPVSSSNPDPTFVAFRITGVLEVDSSLAEIPYVEGAPDPFVAGGDCLMSVTGMGDYFFNYKVLPRTTAEIALAGTGCPAAEAVGTCTDGLDNDANGFTDCMDRGCSEEPTCTTSTTVEMIQSGGVTGGVILEDVVVTGIDNIGANSKGFWVSDNAQAAANQGVFVFTREVTPTVVIGDIVDVTGMTAEFDLQPPGDTVTQITQVTVGAVSGNTPPIPLAGIAVSTLNNIGATGEPYESVLVSLTNLRVMAELAPGDRVQLTNGTDTIVMDDDSFNYAAGDYPVGTCFSSVVGIMTTNIFDDERRLLPRAATDLVTATCP